WPPILAPTLPDRKTAQAEIRGVLIRTAVERADDRELVHHSREARQVLADLDPLDVRANGTELAADLERRVRLQVEDVLMRRTAREKAHDDAFRSKPPRLKGRVRARRDARILRAKDLGKRKASRSKPPGTKETPPVDPVAIPAALAIDGEHERASRVDHLERSRRNE